MKVVEKAYHAPGMCVVSRDIDGPFVDLETWTGLTDDAHLYLHVPVAEEIGRTVGMIPKGEVEGLQERVAELAEEIEKARRQIAAYEQLREEITDKEPIAA
jgi:hypothetical protein